MSVYRCQGCRQHLRGPPFQRIGLGGVCSASCALIARQRGTKTRRTPDRDDELQHARALVMERDGNRCRYCGGHRNLHIHHITYRSSGVDHQPHNLITLCTEHHDLVHTNKRVWQPVLRAYIWIVYTTGRRRWLRDLEREIAGEKTPNM